MSKAKTILDKAKETIKDRKGMYSVVTNASSKLKEIANNSPEWKEFRSKINVLINMVKSHLSGEYKAFSVSSIILIVFALLYFITPIDAIPDFIPALGFTDDASILYLIWKKLNKDIEAYLRWSGETRS